MASQQPPPLLLSPPPIRPRSLLETLGLLILCGSAAACGPSLLAETPAPQERQPLTFERHIRPLLKHHCVHCHGEGEKLKGGLDVRLRRFLVEPRGDAADRAILPGAPEHSELLRLVKEGEMPPKGKKLSQSEVLLLEEWIAQGAPTARPEPEQVPLIYITEEDREFWAFQPIRRPNLPRPKGATAETSAIDRFVLAKLQEKQLGFSTEAPKAVLLRRASLDLTGLPPTPAETAAFEADTAPDAFARLVDRLLASPHYGERWGRHWLDIAGYADSDGYTDADPPRPWAYHYRDYVIRSINADKPLDRFIREQLAGDEQVTGPLKNMDTVAVERLSATGFLRMVPDGTAAAPAADQLTARNAVVAESIKVVSTSLLGMTVGCAQCHDHKHDPIPQRDYYQLRAIFEPGWDPANWRVPAARLVSLMTDAERAKNATIEAEAKGIDDKRKKREDELIELVLGWELEKRPEELRAALHSAYRKNPKSRTPEELKLLKEHPTINQLSPGSLYLYDRTYNTKHDAELKQIAAGAIEIRKRKTEEVFLPVFNETPAAVAAPPATSIFHRGDPKNPKDTVGPADLTILASFQQAPFGQSKPSESTTGRRGDFARHLTSGSHPLATRVLVNRIWHHHFGRGIVGTPADFGHQGDRPTHPELLDWLASELVARRWSMKEMHRLIMNSAVYKQSSMRTAERDTVDPDNLLLSRASVRRLDAETLRDAMLLVSGQLNPKMFGTPVPVMLDTDGQVIVGVDTTDTAGRPTGKVVPLNGEEFRRSVYVQMRRSRPLGMLETFDLPKMEPNCELRTASTVAPQSLALMNSAFALSAASAFAERVQREAGPAPEERIKQAWKLALGTLPSRAELQRSSEFLKAQAATLQSRPAPTAPAATPASKTAVPVPPTTATSVAKSTPSPELAALATLCQALLNSNAFLYAD
jgi:hypothetical protein